MLLHNIATGLASRIPGIYHVVKRKRTGGSDTAEYCYGVWIKHLCLLWQANGGMMPARVAELGPGDSLGVGLAALLSGASEYFAFDVHRYATTDRTLAIFDQLVQLFTTRAARPVKGWPEIDDLLDDCLFPSGILHADHLASTMRADRVGAIRAAICEPGRSFDGIRLDYRVPWSAKDIVESGTVDLVLSHSVLEHVVDLDSTYAAMHRWLAPGAWMSHQVDLTSHGLAAAWNGHWSYPDWLWRVILGRRPFLLNREPVSGHLRRMQAAGFEVMRELVQYRDDGIRHSELASTWRALGDADLRGAGLFIQARKPEE